MSELVLFGVIAVLAGLLGWRERENKQEREKLINAYLSKNAQELKDLEVAEKTKPVKPIAPMVDPMLATADMSDEEFDEFIQKQLEGKN